MVGKLLQELEELAVEKSNETGSSSDRMNEKYGDGAKLGESNDILLNVQGNEEGSVLDTTEQKWSLVPTHNKVQSGTEEGKSKGITVSPSRFNVLAISEDEEELDDIEEGELVPVVSKTELLTEAKRGGQISAVRYP